MKQFVRLFVGAVTVAFTTMGVALPAAAQDKGKTPEAAKAMPAKKGEPTLTVYLDNDKVRVFQATFKPGDAGANVERPLRVIHVIKGGTLTLHYPDGKTEKLEWKTGETKVREPSPVYSPKNEGKSDIVLHVVYVKEPKK